MQGYIKLHRKIIGSEVYLMPPLYLRVFERLFIEANHMCKRIPYNKSTKLIKRGERLTNIRQIAEWVGWYERGVYKTPNPKIIKEILDWLHDNEMIEIYNKSNRTETHYNIVNYNYYQSLENIEVTEKKQEKNKEETEKKQEMPQNNNDKECNKNDNNENKKNLDNQIRYDEDSKYYQIASYIRQKVLEVNPNKKIPKEDPASMDKWSDDVRKIIELDNRSIEAFREVVKFVFQKSDFWDTVIQSPAGLRKNWDKIIPQMKRESRPKGKVIGFKEQMEVLEEWVNDG